MTQWLENESCCTYGSKPQAQHEVATAWTTDDINDDIRDWSETGRFGLNLGACLLMNGQKVDV